MKRPGPFARGFVGGIVASVGMAILLAKTPLADVLCRPLLREDTAGSADAIVVLGAAVDERCQPNTAALRRTLLGLRLFRQGRAPRIVFTGGLGSGSSSCASARVMADFAIGLGAPSSAVLVEDRSTSTWENATRTAELLRPLDIETVLLVTDGYHMRRAEACFVREGFRVERSSVPSPQVHRDNLLLLVDVARELAATGYYRLRGWI
jgi:uncharacterized SAM-binding protein YcdF (DUF218 family)